VPAEVPAMERVVFWCFFFFFFSSHSISFSLEQAVYHLDLCQDLGEKSKGIEWFYVAA
jgi:hypothetical protein